MEIIRIKCDMKVIQSELDCAKTLIKCLEKTIHDKETIINLLNGNKEITTMRNECDVASSTKKSLKEGIKNYQKPNRHTNVEIAKLPTTREKLPQRDEQKSQKMKKVIGSAENKTKKQDEVNLQGAPRKAVIHLGKVSLNATEDVVYNYLCKKFPMSDFKVEACPTREGASSLSFKIEASFELLSELYKSDNWPTGVTVSKYKFFRTPKRGHFSE